MYMKSWLFHVLTTAAVSAAAVPLSVSAQSFRPEKLTTEYKSAPIGIAASQPRMSWQIQSSGRDFLQSAYEVRTGANAAALAKGKDIAWQSGKVNSGESLHIPYGGGPLASRQRVYWQVRVFDKNGKASPWSEVASWEMGLLQPADWQAKWIARSSDTSGKPGPSPLFRKAFRLSKPVQSARLYVTAHGLYEAHINGKRVGDDYLTPGWTAYDKRLQYQVYDITPMLRNGENAIGAMLGDGWYRGNLVFFNQRNTYGKTAALLLQAEITYRDGSKETIATDGSWKSVDAGPVRYSDIYNGETVNTLMEITGWADPGFHDASWEKVAVLPLTKDNLVAQEGPGVKQHERLKPVKFITTPEGDAVVDFGQNMVGWVELKVKGKAGDTITLHHAEVLDKAGNFYTANLRAAKQENKFVLNGWGTETLAPRFTFQGFRYIRVKGLRQPLDTSMFTGVAVYSDMGETGSFSCSHPLINQLQKNIQWGQKGNFVDVPTDCPQRDERLGWTGDAQVFFNTAAYNMNVTGFFTKWMKDVAADQRSNGDIPVVIPDVKSIPSPGSAGWGDVVTIIPWNFYQNYGDRRMLEVQYESMRKWVDYITAQSKSELWNHGPHFGDWLFYSAPHDNDGRSAITDKYLIAQAFYIHSTQNVINAAKVLGKGADVEKYEELIKRIKAAFIREYVTPNGRMVSSTQTAYVLALNFDILPEAQRASAAKRLADNIASYGNHLTTGFLGTPYLCHVLTRFGYTDVAYKLLMQESYPSWLYPVKMGATTIWERWDGIKPDGTFQDVGMNSFNHYAYGAIGDWMYKTVTGIQPDPASPGYKQFRIQPRPGGGLTHASAEYKSLYGTIASKWKLDGGRLKLEVTVPANTTAKIVLPGAAGAAVTESGKPVQLSAEGKDASLQVGSGNYAFEYAFGK
ncbi:family 78 glycoside hydrolase catalytic domain [Chitinophaga sp. NPDC101104]|uniref:family 78 glycoside hydrolase catalytic domain n=1 Tax=Chitinophaga sp. NPDC101104 TaxID=3390561 RepID=UPI003CFFF5CC